MTRLNDRFKRPRRSPVSLLLAGLGISASLAGTGGRAWAEPLWWTRRGVTDPALQPLDHAVALRGQAKHVAMKAFEELEASLAPLGGAGDAVKSMIASDWFQNTAKDHAPCQIGQLKTLAAPFYDRLRELNIEAGIRVTGGQLYPWTEDTGDDSDSSPASIGQLKQVFSFNFDEDGDGLPDWWEARVFGTYAHAAEDDPDGDGLSNAAEFKGGTVANLADSDYDGRRDGEDKNPLSYDEPAPVVRGEGLEVFTAEQPAARLLAGENAVRAAKGLAALSFDPATGRIAREPEVTPTESNEQ